MNKKLMTKIGFGNEVKQVIAGICPTCSKPIDKTSFVDAISIREYNISGICQDCQDKVFNVEVE
jgi:hypothetical protein